MNARKRVLTTIEHIEPNRLPVFSMGFEDCIDNYMKHFAVKNEQDVYNKLNIDVRSSGPNYKGENIELAQQILDADYKNNIKIGSPLVFGLPDLHSLSDNICKRPFSSTETIRDIEKYNWPDPDDFDYKACKKELSDLQKYALTSGS